MEQLEVKTKINNILDKLEYSRILRREVADRYGATFDLNVDKEDEDLSDQNIWEQLKY